MESVLDTPIEGEGQMKETVSAAGSARQYMLELAGAMVLYALVLMGSVVWMRSAPDGAARWLVALLPMLPALLAGAAIVRFFGRMDELARRALTESLAFAFATSALLVLTLGFLETGGIAAVSAWWIWVGMGVSWLLGAGVTHLRYR
jgi:hypothetical protein